MEQDVISLQKFIHHKTYSKVNPKRKQLDYMRGIFLLKNFIDIKDHYTYTHSINVSKYSMLIGIQLELDCFELHKVVCAGLLHDIGKAKVPKKIILKKGILSSEDFAVIKSHSKLGADIVSNYDIFQECQDAILYHHERFDGKGYPEGLKREEIPLLARIINVADSFDAMTTDRPYKEGISLVQAIDELEKNSGYQFDKNIVQAFLKVLERNNNIFIS